MINLKDLTSEVSDWIGYNNMFPDHDSVRLIVHTPDLYYAGKQTLQNNYHYIINSHKGSSTNHVNKTTTFERIF